MSISKPTSSDWYEIKYFCESCNIEWYDEWDCYCNDRCPICRAETEPYSWKRINETKAVGKTPLGKEPEKS